MAKGQVLRRNREETARFSCYFDRFFVFRLDLTVVAFQQTFHEWGGWQIGKGRTRQGIEASSNPVAKYSLKIFYAVFQSSRNQLISLP